MRTGTEPRHPDARTDILLVIIADHLAGSPPYFLAQERTNAAALYGGIDRRGSADAGNAGRIDRQPEAISVVRIFEVSLLARCKRNEIGRLAAPGSQRAA